jgi:hypothetical protein
MQDVICESCGAMMSESDQWPEYAGRGVHFMLCECGETSIVFDELYDPMYAAADYDFERAGDR